MISHQGLQGPQQGQQGSTSPATTTTTTTTPVPQAPDAGVPTAPSPATHGVVAYIIDEMRALKAEIRIKAEKTRKARKKDKLRLQQMERHMHEMARRVQELEEDRARLRSELAARMAVHHAATPPVFSRLGSPSAPSSSDGSTSLVGLGAHGEAEWGDAVCLWEEMLSHLPFLRHFDLAPSKLAIHDLRPPIAVFVSDHKLNWKTSPFFINPQFSRVSGFSMRELLARDIVVALPKQNKLRIRQAFRSWSAEMGFLSVGHFCGLMEHSGGFMLQLAARYQIFTVQQRTYGVLRIDRILAEDRTRSLQDVRLEQEAEWAEVAQPRTRTIAEEPPSASSRNYYHQRNNGDQSTAQPSEKRSINIGSEFMTFDDLLSEFNLDPQYHLPE